HQDLCFSLSAALLDAAYPPSQRWKSTFTGEEDTDKNPQHCTNNKGKMNTITSIPLDMSVNAVDDMYFGCTEQMRNKLKNTQDQLSISNKSQKDLKNCLEKAKKKTDNAALTPDHVQAICTYTSDGIYKEFNRAVREDKSKYGKSFPYQSLHFWLTDAIQVLNEARRKALKKPESCETTYRRTHDVFTGKVNDRIRLGSFSSTSRRTDLKDFGKETCFVIETCLAAYVAQYSIYDQEEVLIPPYETFKITKKIEDNKDKPAGLTDSGLCRHLSLVQLLCLLAPAALANPTVIL
uniref:NAD(P)(+)--arginine ADP-ribosyltransferase n=1 Tax=Lates calcarifer TaxID=8187 RepID=A0A4W6BYV4_LATCA